MIRDAHSLQIKRIINLNPEFAQHISFMKWSPQVKNELCVGWNGLASGKRRSGIDKTEEEGGAPLRLLVADEETIQVYDMKDDKWTATINQGFGGIRNVDFGRNQDEVIVFSDYQVLPTSNLYNASVTDSYPAQDNSLVACKLETCRNTES